MKFEGLEKKE